MTKQKNIDAQELTRTLKTAFVEALANAADGKPSLGLDLETYLVHLAECEGSEEEKLAVLRVVERILSIWVDMGFGLDPFSQACGQLSESFADGANDAAGVVKYRPNERKNE